MYKVLITGGAGYLGCPITKSLLEKGYEVLVYDDLIHHNHNINYLFEYNNFKFVKGNVLDWDELKNHVKSSDIIIPLAAIVGAKPCEQNKKISSQINFDTIKKIVKNTSRDQFILYPNTNSGYGTKSNEIYCDENTPLEPISHYGITKVNAEKIIMDRDNSTAFRLATVFGPSSRMRTDLIVNNWTLLAYQQRYLTIFDPEFSRNFIHVLDIADCFAYAIENKKYFSNQIFNLGNDTENMTKIELANLIKSHMPQTYIHINNFDTDPDKRNYVVSNEKLKKIGFEPSRTIQNSIESIVDCYKSMNFNQYSNY